MIHVRLKDRKTPKGEIECPIGGTIKPSFCQKKCAYAWSCRSFENYLAEKNNHISRLRLAYWTFRAKLSELGDWVHYLIEIIEDRFEDD